MTATELLREALGELRYRRTAMMQHQIRYSAALEMKIDAFLSQPEPQAMSAEDQEGFYEKLWKDFVSIQRGDAQRLCEKAERYYREQQHMSAEEVREACVEIASGFHCGVPYENSGQETAAAIERRIRSLDLSRKEIK